MKRMNIPIISLFFLLLFFQAFISKAAITVVMKLQALQNKNETIQVTGFGIYPDNPKFSVVQKRKLAERGAVVDGYRKLLELINGVIVDSETTLKNYIIEHDSIKVKVSGMIRGAKQIAVRHSDQDSVEVDMEITLGKEFYKFCQPYVASRN